ncbi:thioesterase [Aliidongia dinghuensis]|uniref:Thioesterase n=1 Tax=Aliidongia dinghuensis TaxID=1867774 RepID=A0A8J3E555_9PROT|nr:PaaI family thioesterase [Aliidongia dinghuensis]GGF19432.1 thioesterase [Aliidongia dinghuensis]
MTRQNPATHFGLVPREEAARLSGLDFLRGLLEQRLPAPPFAEAADVWPVSVEPGRIVFEGAPSARFYNPMGIVHGGWIALLLDTAMGCAIHSALTAGQSFATTDMHTSFVRAVTERTGTLRCEGTLLHLGGRVASAEGKLFDGEGRLIAHGTETCSIMDLGGGR